MNEFSRKSRKRTKRSCEKLFERNKFIEGVSMEAIIELKDIKKAYGQTEVLNHFDLSIDQGEFITIIGTSGSGKTTVLKMINGLIQPTSGHVKVHGQDIQEQLILFN